MRVSLDKPQPPPAQKVRNILIRSFTKDRQNTNPRQPENSYILKYSPKYYRSLAIEIKPSHPLLSKIKKIKKLKKLEGRTGVSFREIFPQDLWFNLLANNRKEIEETPQIFPNNNQALLRRPFWERANLQKLKIFPNVTRLLLSKWRVFAIQNDSDPFISSKEPFVRYIWNLRRLRSLEISVNSQNYEQAKWVFEKLDGMGRLFERLETFTITITNEETNFSDLFQYRNLHSYLTGLSLYVPFDPTFAEISQICKNLKSFSFQFSNDIDELSEFQNLMASIHYLKQLKSIEFGWPQEATGFWGYFKPQSSLRQLTLSLNTFDLLLEGLFGGNTEPKDAVGHWEDIQELDVLTFHMTCSQAEEIIFAKQFITMILKKVQKVRSLRYFMTCPYGHNEPFFVEEVPHLYESLERFEYSLSTWSHRLASPRTKLDLKMMKPFRNLKEVKLDGFEVTYENVEGVVSLLEENQKEGKATELKINSNSMLDEEWLGETLKKIDSREKANKNLKMLIDLTFTTMHLVDLLERLCRDIQVVKAIKGLVISLVLLSEFDFSPLPVERTKEILKKYSEIRNVKFVLRHGNGTLELSKLDGEKEEFNVNNRH